MRNVPGEVIGDPKSGQSIVLHGIQETQSVGKCCCFLNKEPLVVPVGSLDAGKRRGWDAEKVFISPGIPRKGREMFTGKPECFEGRGQEPATRVPFANFNLYGSK